MTAYEEGIYAYHDSLDSVDCPYERDSGQEGQWIDGWLAAFEAHYNEGD